jgi:hypothetical protein
MGRLMGREPRKRLELKGHAMNATFRPYGPASKVATAAATAILLGLIARDDMGMSAAMVRVDPPQQLAQHGPLSPSRKQNRASEKIGVSEQVTGDQK